MLRMSVGNITTIHFIVRNQRIMQSKFCFFIPPTSSVIYDLVVTTINGNLSFVAEAKFDEFCFFDIQCQRKDKNSMCDHSMNVCKCQHRYQPRSFSKGQYWCVGKFCRLLLEKYRRCAAVKVRVLERTVATKYIWSSTH